MEDPSFFHAVLVWILSDKSEVFPKEGGTFSVHLFGQGFWPFGCFFWDPGFANLQLVPFLPFCGLGPFHSHRGHFVPGVFLDPVIHSLFLFG